MTESMIAKNIFSPELAADDVKLIEEECHLLGRVLEALRVARLRSKIDFGGISERLALLREEAHAARAEDLPSLFDQMNSLRAVLDQAEYEELPNPRSPYFAHMQLLEKGVKKDYLLGAQTFLDVPEAPINDWRHAPIASVFFNFREGEDYEQELPTRIATGVLTKRYLLTIKDGELLYIATSAKVYLRSAVDQPWKMELQSAHVKLSGGSGEAKRDFQMGTGRTGRATPDIAALLDGDQYQMLTSHEDEPLLILGGAGCGKTTVALHRLAHLNYRNRERFAQHKLAVIVPDPGLVRLSRKLLDSLGMHRVMVSSFDDFFVARCRMMMPKLPKKIYKDPPASVTFVKRHPVMKELIQLFVEDQLQQCGTEIKASCPQYADLIDDMLHDKGSAFMRLERLRTKLAGAHGSSETWKGKIQQLFQKIEKRLMNPVKDRLDFFSHRSLLMKAVTLSGETVKNGQIEDVLKHAQGQFAESAEKRYRGIDLENLETVDGQSLAGEFEDELNDSIDVEDFAILYAIRRLKMGSIRGTHEGVPLFSHIVIDEAQDLAEIELSALGASLTKDGQVTIAGDSAQQIDPTQSFASWNHVLDALGMSRITPQHLTTTYRSPQMIAHFAHQILGPLAPSQEPKATKEGFPVQLSRFDNDGHLTIALSDALSDLVAREPQASIAVICRNLENAKRLHRRLTDVPKLRIVADGDFDFRPGVDICPVKDVKGLEFDYCIIPDASDGEYPDTYENRRYLHVASTRAIHQLWVACTGQFSEIIPREG
jgi:DNA helicase II / ATP-dependent DNA helicase PcrA